MHLSPEKCIFKYTSSEGRKEFCTPATSEASSEVTDLKNHFQIWYVDKMSGDHNQKILCKSRWMGADFKLVGNEFHSIIVGIILFKSSWGSYALKTVDSSIRSVFATNPRSILEGKTTPSSQ